MRIESLEDTPLLHAVLDMQSALSKARTEGELVYGFATRFSEISAAREVLDVAVCDRSLGTYRVMDRIDLTDPHLDPDRVRANCRWGDPPASIPVRTGGLVGALIGGTAPMLARDVDPDGDPILRGWIVGPRDALAVPVFYDGNVTEWLIVFRDPGLALDPTQIRASVSLLNMLSRGAYQLKLTEEIAALHHQLERELEEVAQVQRSILPQSLPEHPSFEIAVHYRPSDVAGGDYYDFRTFDDGSFGFVVADVAGHGPAAAVVMAMLRTAMSIDRNLNLPANEIANNVNRFMWDGLADGRFVTAFFLSIHPATGHARYANAGHWPGLVRMRSGDVVPLDAAGSLPLGILPQIASAGGEHLLAPGDTVVLYTDGITESADAGNALFGADRLVEAIGSADGGARAVRDAVMRAVERHVAGHRQGDDQCLLAVRYLGDRATGLDARADQVREDVGERTTR